MTKKLRILLADDHALMREGLAALINSRAEMEVVALAADGAEALRLIAETAPDIVLMDVSMPVLDGIQAARRLRADHPSVRVLAVTAYDNQAYLRQLLDAGACGYVLKRTAAKALIEAITTVAAGGVYLDPEVDNNAEDYAQAPSNLRGEPRRGELTGREREVLILVAHGHTNKEVSARLGISVKTVEVHKANIMTKLGLKNRADVVRYALSLGWLDHQ
ncbi:MAG TPA: response regulator transcription factor [Pyrinomonadaceae bacterium]|nr:response regulator transcription factor [Pyrinomonadaceae bacterium]